MYNNINLQLLKLISGIVTHNNTVKQLTFDIFNLTLRNKVLNPIKDTLYFQNPIQIHQSNVSNKDFKNS